MRKSTERIEIEKSYTNDQPFDPVFHYAGITHHIRVNVTKEERSEYVEQRKDSNHELSIEPHNTYTLLKQRPALRKWCRYVHTLLCLDDLDELDNAEPDATHGQVRYDVVADSDGKTNTISDIERDIRQLIESSDSINGPLDNTFSGVALKNEKVHFYATPETEAYFNQLPLRNQYPMIEVVTNRIQDAVFLRIYVPHISTSDDTLKDAQGFFDAVQALINRSGYTEDLQPVCNLFRPAQQDANGKLSKSTEGVVNVQARQYVLNRKQ